MPDPALVDVAKLPLWGQIATALGAVAAITVAFREGFKPKERKDSDTVVVSGEFADGRPLRELVETMGRLEEAVEDLTRTTRDGLEEARAAAHASTVELRGIREDIHKGVSVRVVPTA